MLADLNFAFVYFDDILLKRESRTLRIEYIHELFKNISDFGFKLSEGKCDLFIYEIKRPRSYNLRKPQS